MLPRLKWLTFQMPMSSPHRISMLGFFVAIFSVYLSVLVEFQRRNAGGYSVKGCGVRARPSSWYARAWSIQTDAKRLSDFLLRALQLSRMTRDNMDLS